MSISSDFLSLFTWVLPAVAAAVVDITAGAVAEAASVASEPGCWEPHGRPGTNSLISSTDDEAALPALQPTEQQLVLHETQLNQTIESMVQTPRYVPKKTQWVLWVHPPKKIHPQKTHTSTLT